MYHRQFLTCDFVVRAFVFSVAALGMSGCGVTGGVRGPGQPAIGPGGSEYRHAGVHAQRFGEGVNEFWVFSPTDPRPDQAPLVVFLHGWGAVHPRAYGAWLQHLVRKGRIVIFPRYQDQDKMRTPGPIMLEGARSALNSAWMRLNESGPVRPNSDRLVWIGHSFGGTLAAKLAASSLADELPPPGAVFLIEPGGEDLVGLTGLDAMPSDAIISIIVGDADTLAGEAGARAIAAAVTASGASRSLEIIKLRSDRRTRPALTADHFAPLGYVAGFPPEPIEGGDTDLPGGAFRDRIRERRTEKYAVDALDYYAFWKIGDALLDAVFNQQNIEFAFGDTPQQRFMGELSDGRPVAPLQIEPIR